MPYQWIEPELFMVHRGVPAFHTYRGGPANEIVSDCHYALAESNTDEDMDGQFDIHELPKPSPAAADEHTDHYASLYPDIGDSCHWHRRRIAYAIDTGFFDTWEKDEPPCYWWLTPEQVREVTEAARSVLADEAENDHNNDPGAFFIKHAEYRMAEMGIADLVDRVKGLDDVLTFDPEQQPQARSNTC